MDLSSSSGLMQTVAETGKIFIDKVFLAPNHCFQCFSIIGVGGGVGISNGETLPVPERDRAKRSRTNCLCFNLSVIAFVQFLSMFFVRKVLPFPEEAAQNFLPPKIC